MLIFRPKAFDARENLFKIHCISLRMLATSVQSSANRRSQIFCKIMLVLAKKRFWLNNQPNPNFTLSSTFSNAVSRMTEKYKANKWVLRTQPYFVSIEKMNESYNSQLDLTEANIRWWKYMMTLPLRDSQLRKNDLKSIPWSVTKGLSEMNKNNK